MTPALHALEGYGVLVQCLIYSHVYVHYSCCAVVATSALPLSVGRLRIAVLVREHNCVLCVRVERVPAGMCSVDVGWQGTGICLVRGLLDSGL